MSTQITTAFVNQFSQNIQLLSQQMGSLMRNTVRQETVNGEKAFFEQIAALLAVQHGQLKFGIEGSHCWELFVVMCTVGADMTTMTRLVGRQRSPG